MNSVVMTVVSALSQVVLFSLIPFIVWLIWQRKKVSFPEYAGSNPDTVIVRVLHAARHGNILSWMECWDYIHFAFALTTMKKDEILLIR